MITMTCKFSHATLVIFTTEIRLNLRREVLYRHTAYLLEKRRSHYMQWIFFAVLADVV